MIGTHYILLAVPARCKIQKEDTTETSRKNQSATKSPTSCSLRYQSQVAPASLSMADSHREYLLQPKV